MISLRFCRENRPTSDIISWFTQGNVSHVDAVIPNGFLGSFERTVPPYKPGVQARSRTYISPVYEVWVDIPCGDQLTAQANDFLYSQIGAPYDYEAILAFAAGRSWNTPGHWICSELIAAYLQHAGILPPNLYFPDNQITPSGLLLVLSALQGYIPGMQLRPVLPNIPL